MFKKKPPFVLQTAIRRLNAEFVTDNSYGLAEFLFFYHRTRVTLTESKQFIHLDSAIEASRLERSAAVRVEIRVTHRTEAARGPARSVDHVHEIGVRFFQPGLLEPYELVARSGRIETFERK